MSNKHFYPEDMQIEIPMTIKVKVRSISAYGDNPENMMSEGKFDMRQIQDAIMEAIQDKNSMYEQHADMFGIDICFEMVPV